MIKGAIFDLDGTLLDSMSHWYELSDKFLKNEGITPVKNDSEELKFAAITDACEYYKDKYNLPYSTEEIYEKICAMISDIYFKEAELKPCVIEFLEYLKSQNVKMCVATATVKKLAVAALERCGALKYFSSVFSCEDIGQSKNSPKIFEIASEHLNVKACDTVVFEDSLHAIKTAKDCGYTVVGIYDAISKSDTDEIKKLCDYYFNDFSCGKDEFKI